MKIRVDTPKGRMLYDLADLFFREARDAQKRGATREAQRLAENGQKVVRRLEAHLSSRVRARVR